MIKSQDQDEFIAVRVQDPRIQNEGSWNSYVDFKIFLHSNSKAFTAKTSCVRRRYSEFVWLRKKLQKNAGLVPVPELPSKSFFFSFNNEDFIEKRRKGLQSFLDKVVHMTVCLSDSQLHLFLQTQLPVSHIQDCVQGLTPYTVTDAILTYASSNLGWVQEEEGDPQQQCPTPVPYESMESPSPHTPSYQTGAPLAATAYQDVTAAAVTVDLHGDLDLVSLTVTTESGTATVVENHLVDRAPASNNQVEAQVVVHPQAYGSGGICHQKDAVKKEDTDLQIQDNRGLGGTALEAVSLSERRLAAVRLIEENVADGDEACGLKAILGDKPEGQKGTSPHSGLNLCHGSAVIEWESSQAFSETRTLKSKEQYCEDMSQYDKGMVGESPDAENSSLQTVGEGNVTILVENRDPFMFNYDGSTERAEKEPTKEEVLLSADLHGQDCHKETTEINGALSDGHSSSSSAISGLEESTEDTPHSHLNFRPHKEAEKPSQINDTSQSLATQGVSED